MVNTTKLLKKLSALILLLTPFFIYSCSDDKDDKVNSTDIINIVSNEDIILNHGDEFFLDIETNLTSTYFHLDYKLLYGSKQLDYKMITNDNKAQIKFTAEYSAQQEGQSYPLTVVKKIGGNVVATGPKLLVNKTYKPSTSIMLLSSPLLSMCLDKNGDIMAISGYSFESFLKRLFKYQGINNLSKSPNFETTLTKLPAPPEKDGYSSGFAVEINGIYENMDRCGTAVFGDNIYVGQRYGIYGTKERFHTIVKTNDVSTDLYREGNATAFFKHPVTNIVVNSQGTLFAVEYSVPGIYELNKEKGTGIWVGSPNEQGSKDGHPVLARFNDIKDMKIDKNDNIYIAEKTKIRKITPDGNVTTLIGTDEAKDVAGALESTRFGNIKAITFDSEGKLYILGAKTEDSKYYVKVVNLSANTIRELSINPSLSSSEYQSDIVVLDNGIIVIGQHSYNSFNRVYAFTSLVPIDMFD